MGSKFIQRHKRKSLIAALLLLFRSRVRYVILFLVVAGVSAPFVVSQDMLYRLVMLPPVNYVLKAAGLQGFIATINPAYSNEIFQAAMQRAMYESGQDSVWNQFLRGMSPMGGTGGPSSLAMLRAEYLARAAEEEREKARSARGRADQVKGAVSDEEKARSGGADAVDFESYLASYSGADEGGGFGYMDQGGGSDGAAYPFMNRTLLGPGGGPAGRDSGVYSGAMSKAASGVPVPGNPKAVKGKNMGRVSGFSWRNASYNRGASKSPGSRINRQGAIFRLSETFAMTGAAYRNPTASSEYQASYTGSTYDGNSVDNEEIQTDDAPPPVPDNAWVTNTIGGASELSDMAEHCSKVSGEQSAIISENTKKIDDISKTLGKPPKCCKHGAVDRWNGKIERIKALCIDNNTRQGIISQACQNPSNTDQVNCNQYNKMKIKKCSKLKCFLSIILAIILMVIGFAFGGILGAALMIAGALMMLSQLMPSLAGLLAGLLGGVGLASFFVGEEESQEAMKTALETNAASDDETEGEKEEE